MQSGTSIYRFHFSGREDAGGKVASSSREEEEISDVK